MNKLKITSPPWLIDSNGAILQDIGAFEKQEVICDRPDPHACWNEIWEENSKAIVNAINCTYGVQIDPIFVPGVVNVCKELMSAYEELSKLLGNNQIPVPSSDSYRTAKILLKAIEL